MAGFFHVNETTRNIFCSYYFGIAKSTKEHHLTHLNVAFPIETDLLEGVTALIRTHLRKQSVFFAFYATKTNFLQQFNVLHIMVLQQWSQKLFHKKNWLTHGTQVILR